jgi:hypothetical protein
VVHLYWLALSMLAIWRITHFLSAEDGPWDAVVRLRKSVGDGFWGELLDCFYCLSLWIAMPFAYWLGQDWKETLVLWPALSAGSILLERLIADRGVAEPPTAVFFEEPFSHSRSFQNQENCNVLLRQEAGRTLDERPAGGKSIEWHCGSENHI